MTKQLGLATEALKITLITVCFNAEKTIERTINSVLSQDYENVEYIVIDGLSRDRTMQIVNQYKDQIAITVSEKDLGMYDALNKGIKLSNGHIIGILNADDAFTSQNVLSLVAESFVQNPDIEAVIGNIVFVNNQEKIVRYYSSEGWTPEKFTRGFMPPHPSFYCKKEVFAKFGSYRTDFEIAADYELMIRYFKLNSIRYMYLPVTMVNMKMGGKSTNGLISTIKINQEILRACKLNDFKTNYLKLYLKYFFKIFEFLKKT